MAHKQKIVFIEGIKKPARRLAVAQDEMILLDVEIASASTTRKIRSLQLQKKCYEAIIRQAKEEIQEQGEKAPLSSDPAAGEEIPISPLDALQTILIERGETTDIQRNMLFTGSKYYVIKQDAGDVLSVMNALGQVVYKSGQPAEIAQYLTISDELEQQREKARPAVEKIRRLVEVKGRHGEYKANDYLRGLYNGLEMALAALEDREPDLFAVAGEPAGEAADHA